MNRYRFLRRMRGPAIIVTFGVTALLNNFGVLNYGQSWPLYLLVIGGLMLAERAAWTEPTPPAAYPPPGNTAPSGGNPSSGDPGYNDSGRHGPWSSPPPPSTSLSITPPHDLERR